MQWILIFHMNFPFPDEVSDVSVLHFREGRGSWKNFILISRETQERLQQQDQQFWEGWKKDPKIKNLLFPETLSLPVVFAAP